MFPKDDAVYLIKLQCSAEMYLTKLYSQSGESDTTRLLSRILRCVGQCLLDADTAFRQKLAAFRPEATEHLVPRVDADGVLALLFRD